MLQLFIPCAKGLEELLRTELETIGASEAKATAGGCFARADLETTYKICLWSRIASRVLMELGTAEVHDRHMLEKAAARIDWQSVFSPGNTFAVRFTGSSETLRHSKFSALVVKDGIIDYFRALQLPRPDVDTENPDIQVQAHLRKGQCSFYLDLSGALHERGYRRKTGGAPIRETLAAAIAIRAGVTNQTQTIADPMCGSGTLLFEAAMIATDFPPGKLKRSWGFKAWRGHRPKLWQRVKQEAHDTHQQTLENSKLQLIGADADLTVLESARHHAQTLGFDGYVEWFAEDITGENFKNRLQECKPGLIITNPPYGERLGNPISALRVYRRLGDLLGNGLGGWHAAVLASDTNVLRALQLRSDRKYKFMNGPIAITVATYKLEQERELFTKGDEAALQNRLRKNWQQREKWAAKEGIDSFRVYDADIPEYNAAIDCYQDALVIQEYAAPATIPEQVTEKRWWDILSAVVDSLPVNPDRIFTRQRKRQKGAQQYTRQDTSGVELEVIEYGLRFKVNLTDYLDTGLFLDHRLVRKKLGQMSAGKKVLNLFAYTGTASVHAAHGGATEVTTVDLSKTYLNWAKDNFRLNHLTINKHHFVHADCLNWVNEQEQQDERWDVIFLDPPSFSNSKRMEDTFDVQRDHAALIESTAKLLSPDGTLVFTTNKRKFKPDTEQLKQAGLQLDDQTRASIPLDFKKQRAIHYCWFITHA